MRATMLLLAGLVCSAPAAAAVTPAGLDAVRVDAQAGAAFPLPLRFTDAGGVEHSLGEAIGGTPAIIVFGLDPKDGPREATDMMASHIGAGTPLAGASMFLLGNASALKRATDAA